MNPFELVVTPYTIRFTQPFHTAEDTFHRRLGYYLRLEAHSGQVGYGEASPLSGFSRETLQATGDQLAAVQSVISVIDIQKSSAWNLREVKERINAELLPSVAFGLETAVMDLQCKIRKISMQRLISKHDNTQVQINGLIGLLDPEDCVKQAGTYIESGYRVLKLKVGRNHIDDDIEVIRRVREVAGSGVRLRLDANQRWTAEQTLSNAELIYPFDIEYIEQPVKATKMQEMRVLGEQSPVPVAADESVQDYDTLETFLRERIVPVVVLKPMLLGQVSRLISTIQLARTRDIRVVLSSAFESIIGWQMITQLATCLLPGEVHGLGTLQYLQTPEGGFSGYSIRNGIITKPRTHGLGDHEALF